ncbi:hypothetical protein LCGC14_2358720 [marine sediment metagenome]|uniref:Uncharacterized protein n=1 Tax=marine sediment metagenome TaxID=412755 RepID=A0A0F9F228_9ZZZZ
MTKIIAICLALALSGCANMTPGQKTAIVIVGTVAVAAIVISSKDDKAPAPPCRTSSGVLAGGVITWGCL